MAPSLLPHWQLLLLLLTPPLALAPRPTCPSGASPVGDSSLYGCVDAATGGLALLGGTVAAEGAAPAASFAVAVQALSTISGCTESAASSTELSTAAGLITATRKLSCGADATWHPDAAVRHATVTDSFFVNAAPNGEGRQLPSLGWNATWSSAEAEMWTAPLSSSLTLANFSTTAPPRVWVGGPSTSTAVLSPTFSPLAPIPLGHCDGTKCSAEPQPCPGHKGRTFCTSNSSSGQCDSPSAPCPPCPQSAAAGTCEYWYGGALTDLQWRQNLIDNHAQNKELLDAPSLALPIVCENGRFLPFILKTIALPRQARDKRWKTQTKMTGFSGDAARALFHRSSGAPGREFFAVRPRPSGLDEADNKAARWRGQQHHGCRLRILTAVPPVRCRDAPSFHFHPCEKYRFTNTGSGQTHATWNTTNTVSAGSARCGNRQLFLSFPYICPEPILAK
jgi:hypothetical protein